ncbi:hypothetical protein GGF31_007592 [Allomyces arbusculus]|nr:hypothetical protein GGF31_007592 [Allomyces arbusculus]
MGEERMWKGFRYILNVVDVASRKLFLEPLKKKTQDTVYLAFKKIAKHEHFGNKPTIHMDNGGEFAALKRDPSIRCVLGKPHVPMGQGMVESLNKQVRRYVNMYLQQGYNDWPMAIPRFQDSLNSLSRRGTGGLSANEAHEMPKEESKVYFEELKAKRTRNDDPLNDNLLPLGATVRYRLPYKSQLEKKNMPTYSATLHTIVQRRKGTGISSPSYKISDMPRWYNASDLQVIKKVEAYEREKRPVVQRVKNTSNVLKQ